MKSIGQSIVLFTSCTVSSVLAFGPRLEKLSNSHCRNLQTRGHTSQLQSSDSEHNESLRLHSPEFDFMSAQFDSLDDFSFLFERDLSCGTFPLLKEQADALAYETFKENETFELDAWDNCGEDCKECEIPIDWGEPIETINVMEYLGVTRVKPLC